MNKEPWIKKIYLYLFALVGLFLITIGAVRLISLGLKAYVFTQADIYPYYPQMRPKAIDEKVQELEEPSKQEIEEFEKKQRRANREREAAESVAMMVVGLPLYLYHWRVIQKDKDVE